MLVSWDRTANAIYLAMGSEAKAASRTVQLDSGTLVDLDEFDVVVGVEIINPLRPLPAAAILALHVPVVDQQALEQYLHVLSGEAPTISGSGPSAPTIRSIGLHAPVA